MFEDCIILEDSMSIGAIRVSDYSRTRVNGMRVKRNNTKIKYLFIIGLRYQYGQIIRGLSRGFFPDNQKRIRQARQRFHGEKVRKFTGPKEGVVVFIFPSERRVAHKMYGFFNSPARSGYVSGKFVERVFVIMTVINTRSFFDRWNR